jgi:hypothetical protein
MTISHGGPDHRQWDELTPCIAYSFVRAGYAVYRIETGDRHPTYPG